MRVCTCSHTEVSHRGDKSCGSCNCSCFQSKEKSLIQRVDELEEQVAALVRVNKCTCDHGPNMHASSGGCFGTAECLCKATYKVAIEKHKPSKCPSDWSVLDYHKICARNSRALYDDYYLKSEVDTYLKHMGAIK